jgi:hypothetical protein
MLIDFSRKNNYLLRLLLRRREDKKEIEKNGFCSKEILIDFFEGK